MPVRFASASDSVDFLPPCPPWLDDAVDDDEDEVDEEADKTDAEAEAEVEAEAEDDDDDDGEGEEALNANVEKSGRATTGRRWWCA